MDSKNANDGQCEECGKKDNNVKKISFYTKRTKNFCQECIEDAKLSDEAYKWNPNRFRQQYPFNPDEDTRTF